jgi:hypothetical protein
VCWFFILSLWQFDEYGAARRRHRQDVSDFIGYVTISLAMEERCRRCRAPLGGSTAYKQNTLCTPCSNVPGTDDEGDEDRGPKSRKHKKKNLYPPGGDKSDIIERATHAPNGIVGRTARREVQSAYRKEQPASLVAFNDAVREQRFYLASTRCCTLSRLILTCLRSFWYVYAKDTFNQASIIAPRKIRL